MPKDKIAQKIKKIVDAVDRFQDQDKIIRDKAKSLLAQRHKQLTVQKIKGVKEKIKKM